MGHRHAPGPADRAGGIGGAGQYPTKPAAALPLRDANAVRAAITATLGDLPPTLIRSITWDQGIEMARHTDITADSGAPVYFCDSRSPWQITAWQQRERQRAVASVRKGTDLDTVHTHPST